MTIPRGTKFGKGSNGNYAFYIYGDSFTGEWGNNNTPTLEQLQSTGFMRKVSPVFDKTTHKPIEALTDNGVEITNVVVPLSPEELAANAATAAILTKLSDGIAGILSAQFRGVTREQADEYIDGKISDSGTRIVAKKLAYNLIDINSVIESLEELGRL
jgi:hypothetical protein